MNATAVIEFLGEKKQKQKSILRTSIGLTNFGFVPEPNKYQLHYYYIIVDTILLVEK